MIPSYLFVVHSPGKYSSEGNLPENLKPLA